ncbi:MAG: PKD domain-containing protein [Chitinophagaceae bacterium]
MYILKSLYLNRFFAFVSLVFFASIANAQFTATWDLRVNKTAVVAGVHAANATVANMIPGKNVNNPGNHNATNGFESTLIGYIPSGGNLYWPTTANDSNALIFPLSPAGGVDIQISSLSFIARRNSSSGEHTYSLSYEANNSGVWTSFGTPQTSTGSTSTITFTGLNPLFFNGATYKIKLHLAAATALTTRDNRILAIRSVVFSGNAVSPPSIKPVVVTGTVGTATKYANTVTASSYTITNGGTNVRPVIKNGLLFGINAIPSFTNGTVTNDAATNGVGTATFNTTLNSLTPNTTYYLCAYAITQADTVYGSIVNFTTLPQTVPTLNTNSPTNVLSNKVNTGGNTIDSGGYGVLEKGVLYSTLNSNLVYPATGQTKATSDGIGNANYATTIKNLLPNTKYYIKAFARNQLGAGYGNLDSFTTTAPVPSITVTPSNLDFGDVTFNGAAPILSYKVNATYLTPAAGNIVLYSNSGYTMATSINGVYNDTLPLSYTSSTITNKVIYVKSQNTPYGKFSGRILHTGGGTVTPNADTTFLATNIIQNPDTLSNAGSDFWCGFGYQEKMKDNTTQFDTTLSAKGAHLSLFIAAGNQGDSVIVELPGIPNAPTFPRKVFVPASGFVEIGGFPVGDGTADNPTNGPDSRLYYTGVSKRGIHIYTKNGVPVSAWIYVWTTGDAAAGAMLFPTNTWNSSYVVQSVGGKANNSGYNNNSFFYVIAKDDNTVITFKPTNNILDSNTNTIFNNGPTSNIIKYKKDSTYTVLLNKGDVFNAMGYVGDPAPGSADPGALDLSGTIVSTTCDKRIAVFGGNGRCVIGTAGSNPTVGNANCNNPSSGSDNLIQQMFPKVAWGTTYLTVPTKNMANNLFRVYVQDVNTDVKLNNVLLPKANLIKGLYYQFDVNRPSKIESNIPISVTQFIVSGACQHPNSGNIGKGDPEMITLSPVQQSIKSTTVYSSIFKNGNAVPSNGCSYINVVVKGFDGVSSFKLDGLTSGIDTGGNTFTGAIYAPSVPANLTNVNAFRKHPFDTSYYYATFRVASKTKHTLFSTQGFNAIAYGVSDGESYGYNAGTTINNLSAIKVSLNPYGADTASGSVKTAKGNLVKLRIALPYDTTTINSIIWDPGADATLYSPTGPQAGAINPNTSKPLCIGTIVKDGRTFNIYESPVQYTFFEDGAYKVKVTINGTFISDCGGTDVQYINVLVGHDDISFIPSRTPAGDCTSKSVLITDNSSGFYGTSILKWIWDFGDGSPKDTVNAGDATAPNPKVNPHTYPANQLYYIKLTTINSVGAFSLDSFAVDLSFTLTSSFTQSQDTICPNASVVFTPTSSANATKWFWNYGDGSALDSTVNSNPVSHQYTTEGSYTVSHWVTNSLGCPSAIVKDTVVVAHKPIADFVLPAGVCLPGSTLFTNTSDTAYLPSGMPYTYRWDFGVTSATDDTSNIKNASYAYPNVAPPAGGYIVSLTVTNRFGCVSAINQKPVVNVYQKPTAIFASTTDKKVCLYAFAQFDDSSNAGTGQSIATSYWDFGDGTLLTSNFPVLSASNFYVNSQTYTVKHVVVTDKGCVSDTARWTIKVNPLPTAATILPSSCITSGSLFFQDNSTVPVDDSIQTPYTYTWNFGDGSPTYTTKDSTHTYAGIGTYYINHSITTLNGCTDTKIDTFVISGSKPVPNYSFKSLVPLPNVQVCSNDSVYITDSSTIAIGTIKKVVIYWDTTNARYPGYFLASNPTIDNNPQNGVGVITPKVYSFKYPYNPLSRTPVIRILTYNSDSCYSEVIKDVRIFGGPKIVFDTIKAICLNSTPKKINLAYDSSRRYDNNPLLAYKPVYTGAGVINDSMFNPALVGVGTHLIKVLYELTSAPSNHCKDSAYAPITVWALPTVKFDTALIKCEGNSIAFTDQSTAGTGTGNIKSWLWNFGNPASGANDSSKINPTSHLYTSYGTYNVTLKVTSDSGCSNTSTPKTITINPKPKVGFISPAGTCAGTPVGFTDTSKIADGTQSLFTHSWNFGDPASGALNTATGTPLPTPSHLYATTPPNPVKLIVTSNNGCIDSASVTLSSTIFPKQHATYIANGKLKDNADITRVCLGNSINFASGLPANNTFWIFGDSGMLINTSKTPVHTYPTSGLFTGQFYADDINGCRTDTVSMKVEIWSLPTAVIQVNNPTCEKQLITFTDKSVPSTGNGNVSSWLWKFGEPSSGFLDSSKLQNPVHTYNSYGNYNVSLTVTSDSGCKATTTIPTIVNVHPKPVVKFVLPSSVCLPLAAQFVDTSKIADGTESQFTHSWTFGDAASGINNFANGNPLTTVSHTYSTSANYKVLLVITSKDGCIDSSSQTLLANAIHNQPTANYTVNTINKDTPRVCLGTPITFKDASIGTVKSYWIWGDEGLTTYLGSTPPPHLFSPAGTYYGVHFIDDIHGCRSDTADFLTVIDSFPVTIGGEKYILKGSSAMLTPYISGATSIQWTPIVPAGLLDDYLDYNDVENPICTPLDSVVYRIDAKGDGDCAAPSVYFTVKIFNEPNIPNVFSPNGDGVNDTWDITSLQYFTGATVEVYTRYGQLVFNSLGYSKAWKGTDLGGNPLPVGVYYYVIKPGSGLQARSGTITILR